MFSERIDNQNKNKHQRPTHIWFSRSYCTFNGDWFMIDLHVPHWHTSTTTMYSPTDQSSLPSCPKVNARLQASQPPRVHFSLSVLSSLLICTASLMWPMGFFPPVNSKDDVWEIGRRKSRCSSSCSMHQRGTYKLSKRLGKWGGRCGKNKGATQSVHVPLSNDLCCQSGGRGKAG